MLTARGAMKASNVLKQRPKSLHTNTTVEELLRITDEKTKELSLEYPTEKRKTFTPALLCHDDKIGENENLLNKQLKWKAAFYEAVDLVSEEISQRFDQHALRVAVSGERMLLKRSLNEEMVGNVQRSGSISVEKLGYQLRQWDDFLTSQHVNTSTVDDVIKSITSLDPVTRSQFSEIERLVVLITSLPISAADAERSFST